ncbi:hypothetical protein O9929_15120 [Vibrio lentus]|nr:hypothetical protein [Vibrio lentus]
MWKQENPSTEKTLTVIDNANFDLSKYNKMLASGVTLELTLNRKTTAPLTTSPPR